MKIVRQVYVTVVMIMLLGFTCGAPVMAADPFYKGKTIELWIGSNPGGGYDFYGRLVAQHIGKHIPGNPSVVPINKPGASSLVAANQMVNNEKADGLKFLAINHGVIVRQLCGDPNVHLDVRKMNWIGAASNSTNTCIIRTDAPYQKFGDMINSAKTIIAGSTVRDSREYYTKLMIEVMGANFKLISGYKSGNAIYVALESDEVECACGVGWDSIQPRLPQWQKDNSFKVFLQLDPTEKIEATPDTEWIMDFVKTKEQRELLSAGMGSQAIARSFVAAPGIPEDRIATLRKAFNDTVKDPEYIADAKKMNLPLRPRTGEEVAELINSWFETDPAMLTKLKNIFYPEGF